MKKQPGEVLCCHKVLAMVTGLSDEEIFSQTHRNLSTPCFRIAAIKLGLDVGKWQIYHGFCLPGNPFPVDCFIATWFFTAPGESIVPHIILRLGNVYFDPCYPGKKFDSFPSHQIPTKYLEIFQKENKEKVI